MTDQTIVGSHWIAALNDDNGGWFAVLVDDDEVEVIRVHPIPFETAAEANRGAARLNKYSADTRARWQP